MIEMLQETTGSHSHYVSKFKNRGGQKQLSRKKTKQNKHKKKPHKKPEAFRQQLSHSKGQDLPQDSDLNPETQSNLR